MTVIKTTIKIEDKLLKTVEKIAIDKNETQDNLMNEYIRKGVNNELKPKKQKVNNDFRDMIGVAKVKKPTNAVELKKKGQRGEY